MCLRANICGVTPRGRRQICCAVLEGGECCPLLYPRPPPPTFLLFSHCLLCPRPQRLLAPVGAELVPSVVFLLSLFGRNLIRASPFERKSGQICCPDLRPAAWFWFPPSAGLIGVSAAMGTGGKPRTRRGGSRFSVAPRIFRRSN